MCVNQLNALIKAKRKLLEGTRQEKTHLFQTNKKDIINFEIYKIVNFIIFFLIFVLLPKQVLSHYIEIKVNQPGEQQILSDKYTDNFPSSSYVNGVVTNLN